MELAKIFSISGKPGLHQMVASSKNGVIVESLQDKKRFHAHANHKISSLEDITIYTENDDVALKDVFQKIGDGTGFTAVDLPEKNELGSKLEEFLPDYDKERVYESDIKKIFKWYNLLIEAGILKAEAKKPKKAAAEKTEEKEEPKS